MRLRPQHVLLGVGLAIAVVAIITMSGPQPGSVTTKDDTVTQIVNDIEPNATSTFTITLQEGGDAEHESAHIFESLQHPGVARVTLNTTDLTLSVEYDSTAVSEDALKNQLLQTGYLARSIEDATPTTIATDGLSQTIHLVPGEALTPSFVRAKAGVPLTITFSPGSAHLASVSIPALGIEQDISAEGAAIRIETPAPGEYALVCAEGYQDATLVVE